MIEGSVIPAEIVEYGLSASESHKIVEQQCAVTASRRAAAAAELANALAMAATQRAVLAKAGLA